MNADILQNKVVVLTGGWSDEREISLDSGRACAHALEQAGFAEVVLLDVAQNDFMSRLIEGNFDVAFIAMHGHYGEDGCIQGFLEVLHMPYTFSGVQASLLGTEKDLAKERYQAADIPTPKGVVFEAGSFPTQDEVQSLVEQLGLPLFVKPAANGSSFGISRVTDPTTLQSALELAGSQGDNVLVEQCIEGVEVTVPVIGTGDSTRPLPVIEIVTGAEFYDSKVKYEPSELHHVIPARLDSEVYELVQRYAVMAHHALGCDAVSRSDFIVTAAGEPYILETNTIPGMTETSLLPDSARHAGIEFPELCRRFVEMALEKHAKGSAQ